MKIKIVLQVGSAYWLDNGQLWTVPLSTDNVISLDDGFQVDEGLVGSELLPEPYGKALTFGQLYSIIKLELQHE